MKQPLFEIVRVFENDKIIIYKRLYNLRNCSGDKRYFEVEKIEGKADIFQDTGRQFRSITQVKKYTRGI